MYETKGSSRRIFLLTIPKKLKSLSLLSQSLQNIWHSRAAQLMFHGNSTKIFQFKNALQRPPYLLRHHYRRGYSKTRHSGNRLTSSNLELVQTQNSPLEAPGPTHSCPIYHQAAGSSWLWVMTAAQGSLSRLDFLRDHSNTWCHQRTCCLWFMLLPQATKNYEIHMDLMDSDAARECVHVFGPCRHKGHPW